MVTDSPDVVPTQVTLPDLVFAVDARGVPVHGRADEYERLRRAGYTDLAGGRLFEGHVDALELIGRLGTPAQRESSLRDAAAGRLFGTWNTEDADGVDMRACGDAFTLRGRKTFASGAGRVTRGLITAKLPAGGSQLILIAMDDVVTTIDAAMWRPLGMEASDSFAVSFEGVTVTTAQFIGAPGDYQASPWFLGGGVRFVAVQCGALERLRDETAHYVRELGRAGHPLQQARLGQIAVAAGSARSWLSAAAQEWSAYDADPTPSTAGKLVMLADCARIDVERAAFAVIESVERSVGARGLLEPQPFARLVRDLAMYVRQPAPDAALVRIAERTVQRCP